MDLERNNQLFRQRSVACGKLTRIQNYISGEHKLNKNQENLTKLPDIFARYDTAQSEMEVSDFEEHSSDREKFETKCYDFEASFIELLHPIVGTTLSRNNSPNSSRYSNGSPRSSHISRLGLPVINLPSYSGDACQWLRFPRHF
jgi:hypothetical protein